MSYEDYEDSLEEDGMYSEFGEGFEDDFDAMSEKSYEKAFASASVDESDEAKAFLEDEEEASEDDYEFDSIVGGRDKKPIMSTLNKGKLSKYEMDDLLNQL